jgi:hypothetical protein
MGLGLFLEKSVPDKKKYITTTEMHLDTGNAEVLLRQHKIQPQMNPITISVGKLKLHVYTDKMV